MNRSVYEHVIFTEHELRHTPCLCKNQPACQNETTNQITEEDKISVRGNSVHVYDEIKLEAGLYKESSHNYVALLQNKDDIINSRMKALEDKHDNLREEVRESHRQIVSEISQMKDMIGSLQSLIKDSLAKFQETSEDNEKHVLDMGVNLGQAVFNVGQTVMSRLKEQADTDVARSLQLQLMFDKDRTETLSNYSRTRSKKKTLPSL